jgi:hypothetical protein
MSVENAIQQMNRSVSWFESEDLRATARKSAPFFMAFLVLYSVVRGLAGAASKPLWFDELLTLAIASQPNLHDMWTALARGFDAQTPLFDLLERTCLALPVSKEIALRLPSILSFPLLLISVFVFVRRRAGELIACLSALVVLSTSLFHMYLIEARGYMLMNACIAFALVCYQRLPSRRWAALLGVSLFVAQSLHYYSVFAMIPFGLAEVVFFLSTRKFRWPVWTAFAFGVLPLIVFWPLLTATKNYYGPLIFSRAEVSNFTQYYGSYFLTRSGFGIALAVVSIAAIIWSRFQTNSPAPRETGGKDADLAEGALLFSLTILPFILFAVVRVMHGGLLERYALPATIGIVLGLASGLSIVGPRGVFLFALFAATSVAASEAQFWRLKANEPLVHEFSLHSSAEFGQIEKFVQSGGHPDLPVVFNHAMIYCQLLYYSPSAWTGRLVSLSDQPRELKYENADSVFRAMQGLNEIFPLRLVDYTEFTTAHQEFLLYADQRPWWTARAILADAASVQLLRADGDMRLFLVKMKKTPAD